MSARVLVVEDDPDLRSLIEFKLQKRGFEVSHAPDGEAALDILLNKEIDLVTLDLMLPKLSGFQVIGQLLDRFGKLPAKFIIVTAINNEEDILRALNLGVSEYVVKPFSLEVLVAQINKVLGLLPGQQKQHNGVQP